MIDMMNLQNGSEPLGLDSVLADAKAHDALAHGEAARGPRHIAARGLEGVEDEFKVVLRAHIRRIEDHPFSVKARIGLLCLPVRAFL